jgi:hypothetical protein
MVVDHLLLDVLGDAASWAEVQPAELNLLPGADATVQVIFSPPRSSAVLAGPVPFGVRVMSQEDPDGSAIEEGQVEVGAFAGIGAVLVPRTARGRRRAGFRLVIENQGNRPTSAAVSASDPDLLLGFRVRPDNLTAEPGTATIVRIIAAPKKRFLKGPDKSLPFQALIQADDSPPVTTDGALLQRQTMPEWLLPALAIIAAGAAVLVALWFTVLRPEVHSAATQAVAQVSKKLNDSANKASSAAASASQAAKAANSAAASARNPGGATGTGSPGPGGGTPSPGTSTAPGSEISGGIPVSSLLQSMAKPTKPASFATAKYKVPAKNTLAVTDIVLENPLGDVGVLQIRAGSTVLFEFGLANFRSIDYHFIQPLVFTPAKPLVLAVECTKPASKTCTDGLSFSGALIKKAPKPTASPSPSATP